MPVAARISLLLLLGRSGPRPEGNQAAEPLAYGDYWIDLRPGGGGSTMEVAGLIP
ncbi:hypothetical protein GCM10020367_62420 [Streptomyces sannanensis]|uniref:Uncharacterized protein n=1 Tax=Streptomyces sannanensis TaxID=285536 RepID=A0ABP6SMC7_9ACTN